MKRIATILAAVLLLVVGPSAAYAQSGSDLFQQALRKERVDGDLKAAIALYQRILVEYRTDRLLSAKALVQLGATYERQGSAQAREAYQRVVRGYAEQKEQAALAEARLAALSPGARLASRTGTTVQRVWTDAAGSGAPTRDGRFLTFADKENGRLGIRDLVGGTSRYLTAGPPRAWQEYALGNVPSPDGQQIAYAWYTGQKRVELRVIRIEGGEARVLYAHPETDYITPMDWSADGERLLAFIVRKDRVGQIVVISMRDGTLRALKTLGWRGAPGRMAFSPDGRFIVYAFPPREESDQRDLYVLATDGSSESVLVSDPANDEVLGWAPDGRNVLFASDRTGRRSMWLAPVYDGRPNGAVSLVRRDADFVQPMGFTHNGTFVYAAATPAPLRAFIATLDAAGRMQGDPAPAVDQYEAWAAQWSRDGRSLVYATNQPSDSRGAGLRLVVQTVATGAERVIPAGDLAYAYEMRWSPDDQYLIVRGQDRKGRRGIFRLDPGSGSATVVVAEADPGFAGWTYDGRSVIYARNDASETGMSGAIVQKDLVSGEERELFRVRSERALYPKLSPDGRQLALFVADTTGGSSGVVRLMTLSGSESADVIRVPRGSSYAWDWAPDGRELFYKLGPATGGDRVMRVPVSGGEPRETGLVVDGPTIGFQVHPDGRRVMFTKYVGGHPGQMDVWAMQNFLPSPKRKQ